MAHASGDPFNLGDKVHEFKIGKSFMKKPSGRTVTAPHDTFHSVRYDFKPGSVDPSKMADMVMGEGNQVTITTHNKHQEDTFNFSETVFKGNHKDYSKECVLIIDHETGEITIEKLSHNITVKKTRSERNKGDSGRPTTPNDLGGGSSTTPSTSFGRHNRPTTPSSIKSSGKSPKDMVPSPRSTTSSSSGSSSSSLPHKQPSSSNSTLNSMPSITNMIKGTTITPSPPSPLTQHHKDNVEVMSESGSDSDSSDSESETENGTNKSVPAIVLTTPPSSSLLLPETVPPVETMDSSASSSSSSESDSSDDDEDDKGDPMVTSPSMVVPSLTLPSVPNVDFMSDNDDSSDDDEYDEVGHSSTKPQSSPNKVSPTSPTVEVNLNDDLCLSDSESEV